jgi:integrase
MGVELPVPDYTTVSRRQGGLELKPGPAPASEPRHVVIDATSRGPRLHDFRHRFAVNTLVGWYRAGLDIERHLPQLSTYLGHVHITDTYWYLTATPELMHLANRRLERAARE